MGTQVLWVSHAVAAASFLLMFGMLVGRWRSRVHAGALAISCLLSAAWAAFTAHGVYPAEAETARTAAWLLLLVLVRRMPRPRALVFAAGIVLPGLAIGLLGRDVPLQVLLFGRLFMAMLGMLLVEQVFRLAAPFDRWGIKFACMGIGALFVFDFYLYSEAIMFKRINEDIFAARGIANALCVPMLAMSMARDPRWSSPFAVSRTVLLHSATLIASAVYLLAMATSGYYLRFVGGGWGRLMQLVFLFGAGMVLAGVLFSGSLRARLKVWIGKHFYAERFDYRQEWLGFTRVLSEDGPNLYERSIQALAGLVESPAGQLWLRKEEGWEPVARWNMPMATTTVPLEDAFCRFLEARHWVVDVAECVAYPARYAQLALPAWLREVQQAWLVVPLTLHGKVAGFVALASARAPVELNWEVTDLLKIAGSQAASYLAHRASLDSLMVARQFDSFNRMSTFIVHDLKNLACQFSLLLKNAERHRANPAFQADVMGTLDHSVQKMQALLQKLAGGENPEPSRPVSIDTVLAQAVAQAAERAPTLSLEVRGLHVMAQATRFQRVIGHLIQNAIEATPPHGMVAVRLRADAGQALIEITDSGHGMDAQFVRERLFRPFDSTKAAGMGIGAFESREYVRELGGQLSVASTPGEGTTFCIRLPIHATRELTDGEAEATSDRG
jgi:putative PEP-CTERM system histidine kinase